MCTKYLVASAIVSVLLCCHGSQAQQVPIYDVQLNNLLKMQQGMGWPPDFRVVKGHEALMRLTSTLANMQGCEVTSPTGVHFNVNNPPNSRYDRWSDGCGVRVKNVGAADQGRWRMVVRNSTDSLTGWSDLVVEEDTPYSPVDPITLQDGKTQTEVNLTTLENAYCLVTQPFTESSLVPGHCLVTLDRTTRAVQGRWNVVLGLPGKVSELQVERNVAVQTEQLQSGYIEESSKLHLFCNILHTEKNITFCRFQKNTATTGFNIMDGLSDGQHSYYGEGFAKRQCGMTIEAPAADDFVVWRCTVGLQEWVGNTITQSAPMQALFKVQSNFNRGVIRRSERATEDNDVTTIFVQKDSSFMIACRAEESLAYCWFQHPNGTAFTPVERQSEQERDFWYTGESLQMGDCGITFSHVSEDDAGEWICHMGPRSSLGVEVTGKVLVRITGPLAANRKQVEADVGSEVTLYCQTANGRKPLDYCRFVTPNNVGISIDSTVTEEHAILGRFYFTPERSLDYGDCSLTIKSLYEEDVGEWTCAALVYDATEESRDYIAVYASEARRPLSTAGIVGMAFGLIILVVVLAGTIWYKKGRPIPWRRTTFASTTNDSASFHIRGGPRNSNGSDNSNEEPEVRTSIPIPS